MLLVFWFALQAIAVVAVALLIAMPLCGGADRRVGRMDGRRACWRDDCGHDAGAFDLVVATGLLVLGANLLF